MNELAALHQSLIGADRWLLNLDNKLMDSYPPYDHLKYVDPENENNVTYELRFALAGFTKEDLAINIERNSLTISSNKNRENLENMTYIHRGISQKNFIKKFTLGEYVRVTSADFDNGILSIILSVVLPEDAKPRIIPIGNSVKQLQ